MELEVKIAAAVVAVLFVVAILRIELEAARTRRLGERARLGRY